MYAMTTLRLCFGVLGGLGGLQARLFADESGCPWQLLTTHLHTVKTGLITFNRDSTIPPYAFGSCGVDKNGLSNSVVGFRG